MKCRLCEKDIERYDPRFHHLDIDESHSADLCDACIGKFVHWQGEKIAKLFPTSALKKRFRS